MHTKKLLGLLFAGAVFLIGILTSAYSQGITTSAVSGVVTDSQGQPVSGATVTAVHEPSGTRASGVTRSNGQYNIAGLRVGGPYTVSAQAGSGPALVQRDLYLALGETTEANFAAGDDVVKLEKYEVVGSRDTIFGVGKVGAGSNFNSREIDTTASVRNNVQDIARLDSRLTLTSLDQGGQLSAQGQNFRFNSFLVDGIESNDPFGLNSNGFGSLRSPVPLSSLEALTIELNPYDVRRSGFTGVLLNAVTKSGTNEFHGSAMAEYSEENLRGENPSTKAKESYEEKTYGFTFGGPIIRNKLFFFVSYEDWRRESAPPAPGFIYTADSLTKIQQILDYAKTAYGYDAGTLAGTNTEASQKTKMAKVDWNISDEHRLSVSYRGVDGTTPTFAGYTSNFGQSPSNYWYDSPRESENYSAQLNSQWTPDFHTELALGYSTYDGSPKNRGTPFPSVSVGGLTGTRLDTGATINTASVIFGTEYSRQLNELTTKEKLGKLTADYSIGDHTITVGGEVSIKDYSNKFLQGYYGSYNFTDTASWLKGTPSRYTDAQAAAGYTIEDVYAQWTYTGYAALLQDTWKVTDQLTLVGGLRLDYPTVDEKPVFNQKFFDAFGIRNDVTNSGNYTLAPRAGFVYELKTKRKTQVRGGIGLFQGANPAVWMGNAYQNAGSAGQITVNVNGANQPTLAFQPDVTKQPVPTGTIPTPNINVTDPNFRSPALWKGNLAVDHELPWLGLIATIEYDGTKVENALMVKHLNLRQASTGPGLLPDGRIRYAGSITPAYNTSSSPNNVTTFPQTNTVGRSRITTFADVYQLTNTSHGQSNGLTVAVTRPMKNHWSAGIAWTRNDATEVSPLTSSTAGSLYTTRAVFNPNEDVASTSNTNTQDKIVARYTREFEFIRRYPTTVSVAYEGRTGRPYSWVFKGDANGDGITQNDLFYMPTGVDDPKVRWTSTLERDAFFEFARQNGLMGSAGKVLSRNSETSPWVSTVDLTISQQIPIYGRTKAELYFQIVNLANLIDSEWGLMNEVGFSYKRQLAGATFDPAANGGSGQYVYVFNANTLDGVPYAVEETVNSNSRWQAKIGLRVSF